MPTDIQLFTFIEAVVLLLLNASGAVLALFAWRVSDVDVREAEAWVPDVDDPAERERLRHNRLVVTEDSRHGEARRLQCHVAAAVIGLFWLIVVQPTNPDVVLGAAVVRVSAITLSYFLIDKTIHHLIARWRFDRPGSPRSLLALGPALRLAWRDWRAVKYVRRTS